LSAYKELQAWKLALELADLAYHLCKSFPPDERYILRAQILRASISVPSNIAEGMGRSTKKDTLHFLYIARGSLYELETLIELAYIQRYFLVIDRDRFLTILIETQKTLNGLIRYFSSGLLR
jgi:four helix bundle protein